MSLTEVIFGSPEPPSPLPLRNPADYHWRALRYNAQEIRAIHNARTKVRDVLFHGGWPRNISDYHYLNLEEGMDYPTEYSECWEYNDGLVLVAIVMSTFEGTFTSHRGTALEYFVATPKTPEERDVEARSRSTARRKR